MDINQKKSVLDIRILGKAYTIGCSPEFENSLIKAAQYLDHKMREIRDKSHVIGLDKIAVLAALHVTHELLNNNSEQDHNTQQIQDRLQNMAHRINNAIDDNKSKSYLTKKQEEFDFCD